MSRRQLLAPVIAVAIALGIGAAALAQSKTAGKEPQWLTVNITKLNAGATTDYIELQTKEVMPAQKKGGGAGRQAWSSGISGRPREFVYISPIKSFAQFDGPSPLVTALGQAGADALNAKGAKLAEPQKSMIVRTRPDLSYLPNPTAAPSALALISVVEVVPGRKADSRRS